MHDKASCGDAADAVLFGVDPAQLSLTEHCAFASALISLLQTHYRTSASDVANMLAQPYMRVFAALPRRGSAPLVALLCVLETPELLPAQSQQAGQKVSRSHLVAFALEQDFPELLLTASSGLRISRVVCDPRLRGRGFGSAAVRKLLAHLDAAPLPGEDDPAGPPAPVEGEAPLLRELSGGPGLQAAWVGASFGLTRQLLRFWARLGFVPAVLSPAPNPQTGELSVVMVLPLPLPLAGATLSRALQDTGPQFGARLLRSLPRSPFRALPTPLCVDLVSIAFGLCPVAGPPRKPALAAAERPGWAPGATDAVRLERLSRSQDPPAHLEHAADLLPVLAEAYFGGALAPLRLPRADEELLLAMGGKGLDAADAAADLGLATTNHAALGMKRIALEATKRAGLGTGKAVLLLAHCEEEAGGAAEPPLSQLFPVEELLEGEASAELAPQPWEAAGEAAPSAEPLRLRLSASWRYPVEAEAGELAIRLLSASRPSGAALCGDCRFAARCLHQWHRQEWVLQDPPQAQDVPVSLVGSPPSPADVEVLLRLWDPAMSGCGRGFRASVRLPPLAGLAAPGRHLRLPLRDLGGGVGPASGPAPGPALELLASWHFPTFSLRGGVEVEQRGRGLLRVSELRASGPGLPGQARAELLVYHRVSEVSAVLRPGAAASVMLPLRLKQNRPDKKV